MRPKKIQKTIKNGSVIIIITLILLVLIVVLGNRWITGKPMWPPGACSVPNKYCYDSLFCSPVQVYSSCLIDKCDESSTEACKRCVCVYSDSYGSVLVPKCENPRCMIPGGEFAGCNSTNPQNPVCNYGYCCVKDLLYQPTCASCDSGTITKATCEALGSENAYWIANTACNNMGSGNCKFNRACNDGENNDPPSTQNPAGDLLIDGADPGCFDQVRKMIDWCKDSESGHPECFDKKDNDGDGKIDYPEDTTCLSIFGDNEADPPTQCNDGEDNDGDGKIDLADPGCYDSQDNDERNMDCKDACKYYSAYDGYACKAKPSPSGNQMCPDGYVYPQNLEADRYCKYLNSQKPNCCCYDL